MPDLVKFRHFEIQDGRHPKNDICKRWLVYGEYVYQSEAHGKQNIIMWWAYISLIQ